MNNVNLGHKDVNLDFFCGNSHPVNPDHCEQKFPSLPFVVWELRYNILSHSDHVQTDIKLCYLAPRRLGDGEGPYRVSHHILDRLTVRWDLGHRWCLRFPCCPDTVTSSLPLETLGGHSWSRPARGGVTIKGRLIQFYYFAITSCSCTVSLTKTSQTVNQVLWRDVLSQAAKQVGF